MDPMYNPRDQLTGLIPFGPHYYTIATPVGRVSEGVTAEFAFDALLRFATPFKISSNPVTTGDTTLIVPLGYVEHTVFPDRMTVVNTTMEGYHFLHPGNVWRSVVQRGDDIYIVTEGYGI